MSYEVHSLRYVVKTPTVELDVACEVPSRFVSERNYVYVCGSCGILWARAYCLIAQDWLVRVQPCPDCGDGRLLDWYLQIYEILQFPVEILRYEVIVWHMQSPQPRRSPLPMLQEKVKPTPPISPKALRSPLFEAARPS